MAVLVGLERDRNKGMHPVCRVDQKLTAAVEKTNAGVLLRIHAKKPPAFSPHPQPCGLEEKK